MKTSQFSTLAIIGIFIILCSSFLYSQSWESTGGPTRIHEVLDISIGYSSSVQKIYATDVDQLKVSTNGGTSWSATGQSLTHPEVVAVRANNKNIALVAKITNNGSDGLFYTTDGGSNWDDVTPSDAPSGYQPQRVVISTSDPTLALLGTEKVGTGSGQTSLFRSTNGGNSWVAINYFKNNARTFVNDILPYPTESLKDYVFVGGSSYDKVEPPSGEQEPMGITTRGVWRSTDQGVNWSYQTSGMSSTDLNITALGISLDGDENPVLFAAAAINGSHAKLYQAVYPDGESMTWEEAAGTLPTAVNIVRSITVNPSDYQQILLGTDVGVYASTNRGSSWTEQNTNLPVAGLNVHRVAFDLTDGSVAYIATGEAIYKGTFSSGSWSWSQLITAQTALEARRIGVYNGTLYTLGLSWTGIAKYSGSSWSVVNSIDSWNGSCIAVSTTNSSYVYAGGTLAGKAAMYRSTNAGTDWTRLASGMPTFASGEFETIIPDPKTNSQYVFAGVVAPGDGKNNFCKSTNMGSNWSSEAIYGTGVYLPTLIADKTTGSSYSTTLFAGVYGGGVFKSTNTGSSWSAVQLNGYSIEVLAQNPYNSTLANTIYVAGFAGSPTQTFHLWKTTNKFSSSPSELSKPFTGVSRILMHPSYLTSANYLWIVSLDGDSISKTVNGGTNWSTVNISGVPTPIYDIKGDPQDNAIIYAATFEGVYKINPKPETPGDFGIDATPICPGGGGGEERSQGEGEGTDSGEPNCNYYTRLSWNQCIESDGDYIEVYRGTSTDAMSLLTQVEYSSTYFVDCDVCFGGVPTTYYYKIRTVDSDGNYSDFTTTLGNAPYKIGIKKIEPEVATPFKFSLDQNTPNPFNPVTRITYTIPTDGLVNLTVYDIMGRLVMTLVNETQSPGRKSVEFDASSLPSGIYLYKLQAVPSSGSAPAYFDIKKMLMIK